jgi:phosphate transport system substrate-binding protein
MVKRILFSLLFVCIAREPASGESPAKVNLVVAAGPAMIHFVQDARARVEKEIGGKIELLIANGMTSEEAVEAIASGKASLGLVGSGWEVVRARLAERAIVVKHFEEIQYQTVGLEDISVVTYKGGPSSLSKNQLKGIFSGRLKNWKSVGGENLPIQITLTATTPGAQTEFDKSILDGEKLEVASAKQFQVVRETVEFVGKTKGAVAVIPGNVDRSKVNVPEQPGVSRPVVAFTLGEFTPQQAKLIRAITDQLDKK